MKPNWSTAPKWARYLAQGKDGEWYWFSRKPNQVPSGWCLQRGLICCASVDNWRDTLEERSVEVMADEAIAIEEQEMKTIEAYMVIHLEGGRSLFNNESQAEQHQKQYGGTLVKLTGEEPPKNPRLLAPCLYQTNAGDVMLSGPLYESEAEARNMLGHNFVSWPAIPDKNGFYTVEDA